MSRDEAVTDRARCSDLAPGMTLVWTGTPRPVDAAKRISHRKDTDDGWWMTDGSGLADYVCDSGTAWVTLPDLLRMAEGGIEARAEVARLRAQVAAVEALCDEREAQAEDDLANGYIPLTTNVRVVRAALAEHTGEAS